MGPCSHLEFKIRRGRWRCNCGAFDVGCLGMVFLVVPFVGIATVIAHLNDCVSDS